MNFESKIISAIECLDQEQLITNAKLLIWIQKIVYRVQCVIGKVFLQISFKCHSILKVSFLKTTFQTYNPAEI